ncbi:hypothetical protein LSH36_1612g00031 [Paralvinella palmiformis]|uniref:Uncharacterized protein n=1 Tax=Paralvinella palmiformis TaxID=53620 RepID=A0AAD9MMJ1_9ANNE|nr:hypothetical protein LSH36_1612g00031 [Paralvinella palmiformis]
MDINRFSLDVIPVTGVGRQCYNKQTNSILRLPQPYYQQQQRQEQ